LLVEDYVGAQLEGQMTHGLGKLLLLDAALAARRGEPRVVIDTGAYALIDGNGELGHICALKAIDLLTEKAQTLGIAMVGIVNFARYGRLRVIGRRIGERGYVGIVLNNAGPPAVVPFGGIDPILGTNPLCIAFPGESGLVVDISTSMRVWGEIRQAMLEGRELPAGAFIDRAGKPTRNPGEAEAVVPFGDAKGYALCLAVEILGGALLGAKMGLQVESQYDLGCLMIAISPAAFHATTELTDNIRSLCADIRQSRPAPGVEAVTVPGDRSRTQRSAAESAGVVTIDTLTYSQLEEMRRRVGVGLESTNKVD
ncbi:MAG: Ldh family oxidoreductase, partial [Candidatus Bipolaricaulia bacterium]